MLKGFRIMLVLAFAAMIGLLPHAAFAVPPQVPALNPPPPAFVTCTAVGAGAVCEGTQTIAEGPVDTGIVCGSGASAFDIFDQGVFDDHEIWYYNRDGNLARIFAHTNWYDSQWSNPVAGTVLPYTQHNTFVLVLAIPGDFGTGTLTYTGESILRPPHGAPVFFSTGRVVNAPDGSIAFRSGQQNFLDLFVDGDPTVLEPVCAVLGSPRTP